MPSLQKLLYPLPFGRMTPACLVTLPIAIQRQDGTQHAWWDRV